MYNVEVEQNGNSENNQQAPLLRLRATGVSEGVQRAAGQD